MGAYIIAHPQRMTRTTRIQIDPAAGVVIMMSNRMTNNQGDEPRARRNTDRMGQNNCTDSVPHILHTFNLRLHLYKSSVRYAVLWYMDSKHGSSTRRQ